MPLKRLDILLTERSLAASREQAQALIMEGAVWSNDRRLEKPGQKIQTDSPLEIRSRQPRFVSRAGEKLEAAISQFALTIEGRTCLDVGASTGGFTDCLLQHGAEKVFAVDVGYGQLDYKLRNDERVVVIEKCNARFLTKDILLEKDSAAQKIDFVCMDTSFISLMKIIPAIQASVDECRDLVVLFKPQFEVGKEHIGRGGIVREQSATDAALESFEEFMVSIGFRRKNGPQKSPLPGKKSGNVEYLIQYEKA